METVSNDWMITTSDNPFNPFTQFDEWQNFDSLKGYNTCSYLARICTTSDELPQTFNDSEINNAIDEILKYDLLGNYVKVNAETAQKFADYAKKMMYQSEESA